MSSNLTDKTASDRYEADGIWRGPGGDVLVELKRTNNARDVRSALLALAYSLAERPATTQALCVLTQTRLSRQRLQEELERFRWLVRPDVAGRIDLVRLDDMAHAPGRAAVRRPPTPWIEDLVAGQAAGSRVSRQTAMSVIALAWLRDAGPMTAKALQAASAASYPTVAAAIAEFAKLDLIEQLPDRRISLRYLPVDRWLQLVQAHGEGRQLHRYIDPTGQARTPDALMARLFRLQGQGAARQVGVGGVLGAKRYVPDLDISASPRLDLSVYGDGGLDFVQRLDAALEPVTDPRRKANLAVHVTAEPPGFLGRDGDGSWASEMECGADLVELGLMREARELFEGLRRRSAAGPAGEA